MIESDQRNFERVLFLNRHFVHHSAVSGYEQLALRWPDPKRIEAFPERPAKAQSRIASNLDQLTYEFRLFIARERFSRLTKRSKYKLVHVLYGEIDLPLHVLPQYCKTVATIHQPVSHLARSRDRINRLRRQLAQVDLCITVSTDQVDFIKQMCPSLSVQFVPHGVDTTFFSPLAVERKNIILIVGNWYRDNKIAEETIKILLRKHSDLRFHIIGNLTNSWRNDSPRVKVLPRLSDEQLHQEYAACACVFLPLKQTTANNTLLEAVSCGTPVVAPKLGGILDYVSDGDTLYNVDEQPEEIAARILRLVDAKASLDKAYWRSLGENHAWGKVINRMHQLYTEL